VAELVFADRPGARVPQRDQPVGDLLAVDALLDLLDHLPAGIGELLELEGSSELGLGAAPARSPLGVGCQRPRLLD